jgi:hypothetical protein
MSPKKLLVAVALLSVAASAQAGWVASIPESATVTLVFASLALIGFGLRGKRADEAQPQTES